MKKIFSNTKNKIIVVIIIIICVIIFSVFLLNKRNSNNQKLTLLLEANFDNQEYGKLIYEPQGSLTIETKKNIPFSISYSFSDNKEYEISWIYDSENIKLDNDKFTITKPGNYSIYAVKKDDVSIKSNTIDIEVVE